MMKRFTVTVFLFLVLGCTPATKPAVVAPVEVQASDVADTTFAMALPDTIAPIIKTRIDTVYVPLENKRKVDSLIAINKKLNDRLFIVSYKMERVKYYLNICLRNPTQDKFLKGWVRRAIN